MQILQDILALVGKPLFIDDTGTEPIVKHYGNEANIISEILSRRYDRKMITYIKTNLSAKALKEKYGVRIYSRMREMFNYIILPGNDRRK